MFEPARHYSFGTNRHFTEITHDEIADITQAMKVARRAFLQRFDMILITCSSQEEWRSALSRSDESFPEWVWRDKCQMAQAVREEVERGSLVFVPKNEDLRACVKAIQEDRHRLPSSRQQFPPDRFVPRATIQPMYSSPTRVLRNLDTLPYTPGAGSLSDAQPFEYVPDMPDGGVDELAGGEGTPRNNQAQNKQFKAVVKALGLNQAQARQLHEEISKQRLGYHDMLERGQDMFGDGDD
ncbi:hypothetical protein [Caballeronia cordobensis]|uniref:hypothetical protein n=1 Tax=Caballeronia cordobensis TaxID=1353886 RepID=UPI001186B1D3